MNADEIYREIQKRKLRAKSSGICDCVWTLYSECLPAIYRLAPEHRPAATTDFEYANDAIGVTISGKRFLFKGGKLIRIQNPPLDIIDYFELKLEQGEITLLQFGIHKEHQSYGLTGERIWNSQERPEFRTNVTVYKISEVDAFIDGPWVDELLRLLLKLKKHLWEGIPGPATSPVVLEDLRKRFGL